jgi:hypothetical protein
MRGYFWTNMYLSPIQKGIQTAHCITQIMGAWTESENQIKKIRDYASNHMTKIVFDGGNCAALEAVWMRLVATDHAFYDAKWKSDERGYCKASDADDFSSHYPMAKFYEDAESLGGALTCVGIVVPENVYEFAAKIRDRSVKVITNEGKFNYSVMCTGPDNRLVAVDDVKGLYNVTPTDIAIAIEISQGRLA